MPYLEKVLHGNLAKASTVVRTMRAVCQKDYGLKESWTDYRKWGQRPNHRLRFSKSGDSAIERAYATHFVSKRLAQEANDGAKPQHPPRPAPEQPQLEFEFITTDAPDSELPF